MGQLRLSVRGVPWGRKSWVGFHLKGALGRRLGWGTVLWAAEVVFGEAEKVPFFTGGTGGTGVTGRPPIPQSWGLKRPGGLPGVSCAWRESPDCRLCSRICWPRMRFLFLLRWGYRQKGGEK